MSNKPKVAFYWCASCGGCEEAVVDLAERLLDVVAAVDIVFWPVALDFKRADVEACPDRSLLASFINGAIRSSEQEEMARLLRAKSQIVVAFGACAQLGGIPGLANLSSLRALLEQVYFDAPSTVNPERLLPQELAQTNGTTLQLPVLTSTVRPLDRVVEVDYYIPGCAPTPDVIMGAVQALLEGSPPAKGSVLAPDRALCEECPRKDTKPEKLQLRAFKRPSLAPIDPTECLLAQGFACLGPATRGGCGSLCVQGNMPCTGCFGPTSRVRDFGAKALSALSAIVDGQEPQEIDAILDGLPDPVGLFYRYSLPAARMGVRTR
jgi:F420-non-reducing hydrogenase small subunit